jgi:hypothetical protein
MADEDFAEFVGKTNGNIVPPVQDSWRNPFGGTRNRETKLDFAITYNLEETGVEGYVDWINMIHDHARLGFAIGDSLWEGIQHTPRPTPKLGNSSNGRRFKIAQMLKVVKEVNDEYTPIGTSILPDPDTSSKQGVVSLLKTRQETFRKRLKVPSTKNTVVNSRCTTTPNREN